MNNKEKYSKLENVCNGFKDVINKRSSVSFAKMLSILFIAFKLSNIINWSWWFVLMPIYIPVIIIAFAECCLKYSEKELKKLKEKIEKENVEK